jgi:hypothetical protein
LDLRFGAWGDWEVWWLETKALAGLKPEEGP